LRGVVSQRTEDPGTGGGVEEVKGCRRAADLFVVRGVPPYPMGLRVVGRAV